MSEKNKTTYLDIGEDIDVEETAPAEAPKKKKKAPVGVVVAGKAVSNTFKVIGTTFLCLIMVVIITACIVATALTVYIMQFADSAIDVDLKNVELAYTSFIYAKDEEGQYQEIKRLSGTENRIWVDIEDVPQHVQNAWIAVEDKRFFEHEGVDWQRTIRVAVSTLFSGYGQGGSTITQQLVKNITGDDRVTLERKFREIFRAMSLETNYTKIDILEAYLNRIPLGSTVYGVGSAAYYYFGKTVDELTIAEAAILAGITYSPGADNPYENLAQSKKDQLYALSCMYDQGYITTDEYEAAKVEQVKFRLIVGGDAYGYVDPRYEEFYGQGEEEETSDPDSDAIYNDVDDYEAYRWNEYTVSQNWYVDAAIEQIIDDIAAYKGLPYAEARADLYKGGYKIYLNMDPVIQKKLEDYYHDPLNFVYSYDKEAPAENLLQSAFVLTDYNGSVIALAGGIGDKPGDSCFNRATQAILPIGSTMKPVTSYGQAVDKNLITYSSMIYDKSIELPTGEIWPRNFEGDYGTNTYIPAWYAVQQSKNTAAVRVAELVGIDNLFDYLDDKVKISTLDYTNDKALSPIALGALTNGMTLLELAGAYQVYGTGGIYYDLKLYNKITDHEDNVLIEQDLLGERIMGSDSAYITNRLMKAVVDAVSGTSGRLAAISGMEVVGKTGTSNDERILAFAGLTPDYCGIIRIGFDSNKIITNEPTRWMAEVWHDFMVQIIDENSTKKFAVDPNIVQKNYCTETGLIATTKCPETKVGYYKSEFVPKTCDSKHEKDKDGKSKYLQSHGGETLLKEEAEEEDTTSSNTSGTTSGTTSSTTGGGRR